jgi:hypothetical protein
MATVYKVIDAVLDAPTDTYTVTIQVNKDNTGAQLFTVKTPNIRANRLEPGGLADIVAWALASGLTLAGLKTQTYTVS